MDIIKTIREDVKRKREFRGINDEFINKKIRERLKEKLIELFLKRGNKIRKCWEYKKLIKEIRAELRKVYGLYIGKVKKRWEYLRKGDYESILKTHISTKERIDFYKSLYEKLWKIVGKPKSILDLACGMNPFSLKFMGIKNVKYFAIELSEIDCNFINEFFKKEKIKGKAKVIDLLKINEEDIFKGFPEFDVAFLFKFLDIVDKKTAEALIKKIPARWIVISFPTVTISGRRMKVKEREWIEKMCNKVRKIEFKNEIFYILKK